MHHSLLLVVYIAEGERRKPWNTALRYFI